ncbi:hypothetical protein Pcinc_042842 [Petrolisthes cinctipes]|uniref:C2H2-type domain-containing protein n=1 Tax=Petrolisthes cinctipes TaxID=88211 RepID=A0AAE1BGQ3_PETCI|nr:hypothetical protein Pcinc_042842 [Petrolisthes cinctipes]
MQQVQSPLAHLPPQTGISLLQEAAGHHHQQHHHHPHHHPHPSHHQHQHLATFKHWISGALGKLQAGHLSPPPLLKMNPLVSGRPPALSVAWVEGAATTTAAAATAAATAANNNSRQTQQPQQQQQQQQQTARPSSTPGPAMSPPVVLRPGALVEGGEESGPHTCPQCHDSFPLPVMLAMHSLNHVEERPFTCPYPSCHYNSVMRGNVKRHIRISHAHHAFHAS